jgi:hypothetical protein
MEGPRLFAAVLAVPLVGLVTASRVRAAFHSWGGFAGSMPSASGSPADPSGIPDGVAPRRAIEPSCPTLMEAADDANDSRPADLSRAASTSCGF